MLDKKEEYLGKKIDDELRKAKANATTNPRGISPFSPFSDFPRGGGRWFKLTILARVTIVAKQALRQKKVYEQELESISGRKMTLTTQVSRRNFPLLHDSSSRLTLPASSPKGERYRICKHEQGNIGSYEEGCRSSQRDSRQTVRFLE